MQVFEAGVEGIGILHRKFTTAHDAETRAALVTEFGLDLIQVLWQLAIAANVLAHDVGDDFFRRRLHDEVALMAIFETQQLVAHFVETASFLPQLGRLHDGHR